MRKTYVLDTNVLIGDPKCLNNFEDNDLVIPLLVLEELDHHKGRSDEVGRSVRDISRTLDNLCSGHSISTGVPLPSGGTLRILPSPLGYSDLLPIELKQGTSVDNMIIGFVLKLMKEIPDAILVSKDINVRIKCSSLGIVAQDYLSMRVSHDVESIYTGVKVVNTDPDLINDVYGGGRPHVDEVTPEKTFSNQIIVLKATDSEGNTLNSALVRRRGDGKLSTLAKIESVFGLKPRNKEQIFSLDLLMDPSIKLVTLTGRAGCGKTLLAIAAGLEQLDSVGSKQLYKKLVVSRPVQPVGRDIGFLPGTLAEKMEPWISPVKDNLEFLLGSTNKRGHRTRKKTDENSPAPMFRNPYLDLMQQRGLIEVEAISFIRGRSIPDAFIIIDEAQNLSIHELKTIITRAGEGTKIVLTGDIEQIDNVHVDTFTNGLTYAVERFKEYDLAGHVTLLKGERSELATLASKIL
jgi:PhoH-like ATPase